MEKLNQENAEINATQSTFSRFKGLLRRQWKFVVFASIILLSGAAYTIYVLYQNESTSEASMDTEKVRKRKRMNDYLKNFK